jgi:hypothetical protein
MSPASNNANTTAVPEAPPVAPSAEASPHAVMTPPPTIVPLAATARGSTEPPLQRPRVQKNRLVSQNSFHAMDFDCYDVHDCYNSAEKTKKEEKAKKEHLNGDDTLSKLPKSSSSNNIVGETSLSSDNVVFRRSTSSESIAAMRRHPPHQKQIRVGICAMDKKAQSQPMKEILSRLDVNGMSCASSYSCIFSLVVLSIYLIPLPLFSLSSRALWGRLHLASTD